MNLYIKSMAIFMEELSIEWEAGPSQSIFLSTLRKACPCAGCGGETDALGNTYRVQQDKYKASSFQISRYEVVGLYGVRFFWKDGHRDGIYTFPLLRSLK